MFKGFYNLTSGMVSHGRRLDVVANNMTNVSTPGYKAELYTDSTFRDVMISRIGNLDKRAPAELGTNMSYILAPSQFYTDYTDGTYEETGLPLDFAIQGEGFFGIQQEDGVVYTRNGSFTLDEQGYLCFSGFGRVLGSNGDPIQFPTDNITVDTAGNITTEDGSYVGQIGVFAFEDNGALERNDYGFFTGEGAQLNTDVTIYNKMVERSNVELVREMVAMMTTQRALQSAAQMSKIYDQVIMKATTELGRL